MSFVAGSVLLQNYISFSIFVSLLDKGRSMLKKDDLIGNIIGVVAFGIVLKWDITRNSLNLSS